MLYCAAYFSHTLNRCPQRYSSHMPETLSDYSLQPLARLLRDSRRTILVFVLLAVAMGLLVHLLRPRQYKARVEFFLKNPMYADRGYLYSSDARMIDYFATDEDIDRLKSLAWSDTVQDMIIRELHLDSAYHVDARNPAAIKALKKRFSESISLYRTENKVVILSYTDANEKRAAAVAARTVVLLEEQLRGFYNEMRGSIHATIRGQIRGEDSAIAALTDTLAALREQYGIYDIISPARYNIMLSTVKNNGKAGYPRGIEEVQNIESVKDELVSDRAKHITLAGQYATGTAMNELPIIRILKREQPPFKREGPGLITILAGSAAAGLFFGMLYVLASYRYRRATLA